MKIAAALIAFAVGANAFTTQPVTKSTAVKAVMDEYDGSINLVGKPFKFDPVSDVIVCPVYDSGRADLIDCQAQNGEI